MKKIFVLFIISLFVSSLAYAEMGASGYTWNPRYDELSIYIAAYNNSGSSITSNAVVVLDTTAANATSGSTLGARITATTTQGDARFIGITDETIANGSVGKVCVRGPHLALYSNEVGGILTLSAGATLAVAGTSGYLMRTVDGSHGSSGVISTTPVVAVLLSGTQWQDNSVAGRRGSDGTPRDLYWVWVGGTRGY